MIVQYRRVFCFGGMASGRWGYPTPGQWGLNRRMLQQGKEGGDSVTWEAKERNGYRSNICCWTQGSSMRDSTSQCPLLASEAQGLHVSCRVGFLNGGV